MSDAKIGIIGGTGLDEIEDITKKRKIHSFYFPYLLHGSLSTDALQHSSPSWH